MAQDQIYSDIQSGHRARMINLRKYYPFFRLCETSFAQYKEGKYELLDMGYIVMAVLRFFIEENNFKEKDVNYTEYLGFITKLLRQDFEVNYTDEENKEVADFIFDKMKNDGKPFVFEYYDPEEKCKKMLRTKMIESSIRDGIVWYSIGADAVEFYLDTKEVKDESRISVSQLLLEKLIESRNFRGATEVIEKINNEVAMLMSRKNEVLDTLLTDVFAGMEEYQRFVDTGMRWFDDEQRLFVKNKELIETVYKRAEKDRDDSERYFQNIREIYKLDTQLKIAMNKHGELLRACMELKLAADELVRKSRVRKLRGGMDFHNMLEHMKKKDSVKLLEAMVKPLFAPNLKKTFNPNLIDDILLYRQDEGELVEKVSDDIVQDIVFDDELEEQRINSNITFFMYALCSLVTKKAYFELREYVEYIDNIKSGESVLKNADFYTFLIHLCHKRRYVFTEGAERETFLDDIIKGMDTERLQAFEVQIDDNESNAIVNGDCMISNLRFERIREEQV